MARLPRIHTPFNRSALPPLHALAGALALAASVAAHPLSGQQRPGPDGAPPDDPLARAVAAMELREIGPTIMGGRIADIAVDESDVSTFYVGVATGGVWKTENGGISFEPLFEDRETASIGDVTLAPSNPNVVWVGTGEPQNRQSSPWGNGVYRSLDGGKTWTHLGLEDTHHIGRIVVHPSDPDVAYVAAVGHLWGANEERGIFRTTDGGETWEKVLYVDENTGAIDLAMDPRDPKTLFAAMYQRRRRAWGFNGGGPGSGLYRTYDGGDTWTELTEGLPEGDKGRIGVDIYRGDPSLVYAIVEADARAPGQGFGGGGGERRNGVYRSTDRGDSWELMSTTNNRPMYYSQIRIDPSDPERIYLGGANLYMSEDGGRTFTDEAAEPVHLDHHALWIDPNDSDHLLLGSDGGMSVSRDRAEHWYQFLNLPLAQFYEIGLDMRDPYHVCGGLQDNGSWCAPSDTRSNLGIRTDDWYNVGGGDGFFAVMHPEDPDLMFGESQGGFLFRMNRGAMESAFVRPQVWEEDEEGEDRELRWNWNTPILMSSHDPSTVYIGANVLFRSRDLAQTWEEISPDLTYQIDREELELMGVRGSEPQMSLNDGQSSYGNLTALAESPLDPDVLYTGADDGRLHVTTDGGQSWTDITENVPGLPDNTYVTRIVASHGAPGTVFAAFDGHRSDDFAPYVYRSEDYGSSWRPIVDGLPHTSVNALAQHPRAADLLFTGNEVGAYVSIDGGARWVPLGGGFPTVPVDDIDIHPRENDLVLGTHGRGIWIMDDISALEAMSAEALMAAAHLFPVRRATSFNSYNPQGWTPGIYEAPNPPDGARIRYHLSAETDTVELTILDDGGSVVRELSGPTEPGLHGVTWDLRLVADDAAGEPMDPGPRVLPGTYTVRLAAAGETMETPLEVRLDPRIDISRADLLARHEAIMDSYRLSGSVEQAENALERVTEQLEQVQELLDAWGGSDNGVAERREALVEDIEALEDDLDDASGGASAWFQIQRSTTTPTADQLRSIDESWAEVPGVIERVNAMVTERVPAFFDALDAERMRPEAGEAVPVPRRGGEARGRTPHPGSGFGQESTAPAAAGAHRPSSGGRKRR